MARPTRGGLQAIRRRLTVTALCAAAFAAIAGCGGGSSGSEDRLSKDEYVQEFAGIVNELDAGFQEVFDAQVDTSDFGEVARLADRAGDSFTGLADRVDELSPPEDIETTHDKLVGGLREFGLWFHDLADTVRTTPAAELDDVLREYGFPGDFDPLQVPGADKIQEAVEEFQAAGYELGTTGTSTETETAAGPGEGDPEAGKTVFRDVADCGQCHTLADAGSTGSIGPNLDSALPSYALVLERVTNGQGIMPSFGSRLSAKQIQDVAAYVSSVAGR